MVTEIRERQDALMAIEAVDVEECLVARLA